MVEVVKAEAGFQRLEQGEVVVHYIAGRSGGRIAGVDDGHNLIGQAAVVVFVPNQNDYVVALTPHFGTLDRRYQSLHCRVALGYVVLIHRASSAPLRAAASMLV